MVTVAFKISWGKTDYLVIEVGQMCSYQDIKVGSTLLNSHQNKFLKGQIFKGKKQNHETLRRNHGRIFKVI